MDIAIFLAWIEHQDDATKTEVIDLINQDNDSLYQTISSDNDFELSDSDIDVLSHLFVECVLEDHKLWYIYHCGSYYYDVWRAYSSEKLGIHFFYLLEDGYIEQFESQGKLEDYLKCFPGYD